MHLHACHRRDALWRVLFWQPLLAGAGLLLVTLLALAGALWASLQVTSLWQLLRWVGWKLLRGLGGQWLHCEVPPLQVAVSVAWPPPLPSWVACHAVCAYTLPAHNAPLDCSVLGGTAASVLVLIVPGVVAAFGARPDGDSAALQRAGGCVLLLAGFVVFAATLLRLALFPAPA